MSEATLERARAGDEHAFAELTDPYRRELWLHCYRILGSLTDAEDMLQETLLAAWRGLNRFEARASVRGWLYRIATNRCLNALRDAGRRVQPEPVPPFRPPDPTHRTEVTWLQPYPDALLPDDAPGPDTRYEIRETVELAFVSALQRLPPRQAATLVLRDVLGFDATEVAGMLDTTETAVKGTLQRARATLDRHRALGRSHVADDREDAVDGSGRARGGRASAPESAAERDLVRRFADAFTSDDIDTVVSLLTDDAWLTMPPAPHEYQGRAAIGEFLRVVARWRAGRPFRLVPTRANNQPAYGGWFVNPDGSSGRGLGIYTLTLAADADSVRIAEITHFLDNRLLPYFGMEIGVDRHR